MRIAAVESTTLVTVSYDDDRELLQLEFCSRAVYQYSHVPVAVYESLLDAASKGRYFNQAIRDRFPYRLVTDFCAAPWCGEMPARCDR